MLISLRYLRVSSVLAVAFTVWSAAFVARAQTVDVELVRYEFPGWPPGSLDPSLIEFNLSASSVNFTGSTASQGSFSALPAQNVLSVLFDSRSLTLADAFSNNSYFQFMVVPDMGYSLDLTSLEFDVAVELIAPSSYEVRSSVDNYSTSLFSGTPFSIGFFPVSVPLTEAAFQGIVEPVTFRFYGYGTLGPCFMTICG